MSKSILKKTSDKVEHSVKTNRTLFFNEEIDVVEEDEVVPDSLEEFEKLEHEKEEKNATVVPVEPSALKKELGTTRKVVNVTKAKLNTEPKTIRRKRKHAPYVLVSGDQKVQNLKKKEKTSETDYFGYDYSDYDRLPPRNRGPEGPFLDDIDADLDHFLRQKHAKKSKIYVPPDQDNESEKPGPSNEVTEN